MCRRHKCTQCKDVLAAGAAQGPRVTQTAVMSAVFFTLFEFWKAQLKGPGARDSHDRCALCLDPPLGPRGNPSPEKEGRVWRWADYDLEAMPATVAVLLSGDPAEARIILSILWQGLRKLRESAMHLDWPGCGAG